jgi:hypothetical protein
MASGQTASPPAAHVAELRARLSESTGDAYAAARKEAQGLAEPQFRDLLDSLCAGEPISTDRIVANALRLRKSQPALAEEFDSHVQESVHNPVRNTRSGRPRYTAWWPHDRPELDPMALELILKRGAIEPLRQAFMLVVDRPNSANVDSVLALAQAEGISWCSRLVTAASVRADDPSRVTPIIVTLHKKWRARGEIDLSAVEAIAYFGGPLQLAALKDLRDFERKQCEADGLAPWADPEIDRIWVQAARAHSEAVTKLEQLTKEGRPESELASLRKETEVLGRVSEQARKRNQAENLWTRLVHHINAIEARVSADLKPADSGAK